MKLHRHHTTFEWHVSPGVVLILISIVQNSLHYVIEMSRHRMTMLVNDDVIKDRPVTRSTMLTYAFRDGDIGIGISYRTNGMQ